MEPVFQEREFTGPAAVEDLNSHTRGKQGLEKLALRRAIRLRLRPYMPPYSDPEKGLLKIL